MKKTLSLALVTIMSFTSVFAADAGSKTVKGTNVSVTYAQPTTTEGKTVFAATQVTLTKDCMIGGNKTKLKAGTYVVNTTASGGEWTFKFSKPTGEVVTGTWALAKHVSAPVSAYTITTNANGLLMQLNDVNVQFPIEFVN